MAALERQLPPPLDVFPWPEPGAVWAIRSFIESARGIADLQEQLWLVAQAERHLWANAEVIRVTKDRAAAAWQRARDTAWSAEATASLQRKAATEREKVVHCARDLRRKPQFAQYKWRPLARVICSLGATRLSVERVRTILAEEGL